MDVFSNIKADAYHDVTSLPYPKESFDLIYASHLLEHVHRHMVLATLNHWGALLKTGGTLRLAVPNFSAICDHYRKYQDLNVLMGLLYGGQDNFLNRHTITFDRSTLTDLLIVAGFGNVREWDWRTTEHKDHDDFSRAHLPHLDMQGMLMSLNLEANKV